MDLFEGERKANRRRAEPLAQRMRPRSLAEVVGQRHLLGEGAPLAGALATGTVPSLILWGPPGTGKTTIARLLAGAGGLQFVSRSAVTCGMAEVREVAQAAKASLESDGKRTMLFLDEIHRFNKAQQDAFLPHVEAGTLILVGATTENPSFEVNAALLSRCAVHVLEPLGEPEILTLLERAAADAERGLGEKGLAFDADAMQALARASHGDARAALNALEQAAAQTGKSKRVTRELVAKVLQRPLRYDATGEEHYNCVSAFIKSLRGSDPDAALYWMSRMLEAGEDPLFVARRMVIFASEDVGNAAPQALLLAVAVQQAVHFVGMPEGWIPLAQAATYLACAPKSNASYLAMKAARAAATEHGALPVPLHLRNAPTELMKELGYGKGYQYPHDHPGHHVAVTYLPDALKGKAFYQPTEEGAEKDIRERQARRKRD